MTVLDTDLLCREREGLLSMVAERCAGWRRELPAIIRGLIKLATPFRKQLIVIASINLLIVLWDTAQPYILAWGVDTLVGHAPYGKIIMAIIFPVLAIAFPYGIVLPFVRELYTVCFFRPRFTKHLSIACLPRWGGARDGGPASQAGRSVAMPLVDTLLRDPLYILRGVVLLCVLAYLSLYLGLILLCGMVLDVGITLVMESKLNEQYHRQQDAQFRINSAENGLHDGSLPRGSVLPQFSRAWDEWADLTKEVEVKRLLFQNTREVCAQIVRVGLMLLVGWWVHKGYTTVGEYIVFISIAGRANDPLYVFFNLQQLLMQNREALRRFGEMSGIGFFSRHAA